ncbi:MAG: hypothetical protein NTX03_15600 [Bacteroidetes bacterium]|nr:hypothetical protein [Bacteroidota bacterium]
MTKPKRIYSFPHKSVVIILFFLVGISFKLKAQSLSYLRTKNIVIAADSFSLDTLSIIPNSVEVKLLSDRQKLSAEAFYINPASAKFYFKTQNLIGKTATISYRTFPYNFAKEYSHKSTKLIKPYGVIDNTYDYNPITIPQSTTGYSSLNRSGSFTRGLSFGNNQDLVLNSFLDIQLNGSLAPGVDILASLNDRSIPLQPEGTTAQLQTFDQKFIQITSSKYKVQLGDFLTQSLPDNYFLKYNKKAQGISGYANWNINKEDSGYSHASLTLSRGKWNRMQFNGIDGNQGPYRLKGASGELYVMVIAGTEKVYINGNLLKRGEQNDYKIDYNTGELAFTPSHLITKYDRIVVEFQYADRNYQRYLAEAYTGYKYKGWELAANAFHEQDNRLKPLFAQLKDEDKIAFANAGDSVAVRPAFDSAPYNPDRIMYKLRDTSTYKNVLVFTANKDSAKYTATFSYVGAGKGNYIKAKSLANGIVYAWVMPINNVPQGEYEPIVQLNAPQKQQMFTFAASKKLKDGLIGGEGALSVRDENTFSPKDDGNNAGYAGHLFANKSINLQKDSTPWKLGINSNYEFRDKRFTEVERYRNVEFNRNWNANIENPEEVQNKYTEHNASLGLSLQKKKFMLSQTNSLLTKDAFYKGINNGAALNFEGGGFRLITNANITHINNSLLDEKFRLQQFFKGNADISQGFKYVRLGVKLNTERNLFKYNDLYVYQPSVYRFDEGKIYLQNENLGGHTFMLEAGQRNDYRPFMYTLEQTTLARDYTLKYALPYQPNYHLNLNIGYRTLAPVEGRGGLLKQENTLLTRTDYLFNLFKGALNLAGYNELSTGKEARRDYQYIQVAKGQGTHVWNDYNHNEIKELNEFELAPYADLGEYIRIIIPSQVYVSVFNTNYQQTVRFTPEKFFAEGTKARDIAGIIEDIASLRINNKFQNNAVEKYLNPFVRNLADTALLSSTQYLNNILYFNKNSTAWGGDFTYNATQTKLLLAIGFDSRKANEYTLNTRFNIFNSASLEPTAAIGNKQFMADYFTSKNFNIESQKAGGRVSWQRSPQLSFLTAYLFTQQKNSLGSIGEQSQTHDVSFETRYNWLGKGNASARLSYVRIGYKDRNNTELTAGNAISYEMLQSLLPGSNYRWQLNWNQRLQGSLQITLSYEGRASQNAKTIHTGRANVSWIF